MALCEFFDTSASHIVKKYFFLVPHNSRTIIWKVPIIILSPNGSLSAFFEGGEKKHRTRNKRSPVKRLLCVCVCVVLSLHLPSLSSLSPLSVSVHPLFLFGVLVLVCVCLRGITHPLHSFQRIITRYVAFELRNVHSR